MIHRLHLNLLTLAGVLFCHLPDGQPASAGETVHTEPSTSVSPGNDELSLFREFGSPIRASNSSAVEKLFDAGCCDTTLSPKERWFEPRNYGDGLLAGLFPEAEHDNTGFMDFNYYWDDRDFNVLTINAGARLPCDFEYFQFANFSTPPGGSISRENWTDFFTEIHLRRPIAKDNPYLKHLDWNVMWADGSGPREVGRLGVRWRLQDTPGWLGRFVKDQLKLRYSVTIHAIEDDGSGWQLEHVFRRDFLDGLVYVGGFTDHNIQGFSDNSTWISETQIGVKLIKNVYAVTEFRYTSFAPPELRRGWGIGLEYVIPFK